MAENETVTEIKPYADPKDEYITSDCSLEELSKKWGIGFRSLAGRSADEKWVQAREKFREELSRKVQDQALKKSADWAVRQARAGRFLMVKGLAGIRSKNPREFKPSHLIEMVKAGAGIEKDAMTTSQGDQKVQVNIFLPDKDQKTVQAEAKIIDMPEDGAE